MENNDWNTCKLSIQQNIAYKMLNLYRHPAEQKQVVKINYSWNKN